MAFFANLVESQRQTDGNGGFTNTPPGSRDGCHQNEVAFSVFIVYQVIGYFGYVASVILTSSRGMPIFGLFRSSLALWYVLYSISDFLQKCYIYNFKGFKNNNKIGMIVWGMSIFAYRVKLTLLYEKTNSFIFRVMDFGVVRCSRKSRMTVWPCRWGKTKCLVISFSTVVCSPWPWSKCLRLPTCWRLLPHGRTAAIHQPTCPLGIW